MVGIKETSELIKFGGILPGLIQKIIKDGFGVGLVGEAIELLTKLSSGLEGADQIPAELKDLDEAELAELKELVKKEIEVEDGANIEVITENVLITIFALANIWKESLPKG